MAALYLGKSDLIIAFHEGITPDGHSLEEVEEAVNALLAAEWESGRDAGLDNGYDEGWDGGFSDGRDEGFREGYDAGYEAGQESCA